MIVRATPRQPREKTKRQSWEPTRIRVGDECLIIPERRVCRVVGFSFLNLEDKTVKTVNLEYLDGCEPAMETMHWNAFKVLMEGLG